MQTDFSVLSKNASASPGTALSLPISLPDGLTTTVHIVAYQRDSVQPRLAMFDRAEQLQEWCRRGRVESAIVGGFFLREVGTPLGELWLTGVRYPTVPFATPWDELRGSIMMDGDTVAIAPRRELPAAPTGDLIQAGPLLVKEGIPLIEDGVDPEGFSASQGQFDSDITAGRYPRAAVGIDDERLWAVVADGRAAMEAGLTLRELALIMAGLGAESALNLDGGGSASLVVGGKLINHPRPDQDHPVVSRPILTALTFLSR